MSESATPESGALSVDQAIASLVGDAPAVDENTAPEAPVEAAEEPETTEGEASAPEAAEDGAETPAEEDETEAAEEPAKLDAPLYWKPEAKAVFNAMTPEQQAVVLAQEGPREEVTAKAKAQAAAEIEKAQKEVAGVQALAQQLGEFLPQAVQTFQKNWGEPDWVKTIQEHGAENAAILKAQYDAEQKQLQQITQATQTAQVEAHKAFVQTELRTLAQLSPELVPDAADPTKGADKRQAVVKYLADDGFPQEALMRISAKEMLIAHKAKLWDESQALLKAPKTPKPAPVAAPRTAARPSAAQPQSSPQRTATAAAQRFGKTLSQEDAIALLVAKG